MSSTIRTETIQTNVGDLNDSFAGRVGSPGYDANRVVHIHRRNRAYVWTPEMAKSLLDSMVRRFYVPPIITVETVSGGTVQRHVVDGGNRITTWRKLLNDDFMKLTDEQRRVVVTFPITLVVMRGLSGESQSLMFRRINKNKSVSNGQLYAMSVDDSPVVREAVSLLEDRAYPLRVRITDHFFDTTEKPDDAGRNMLANAVCMVAGAAWGPRYITKHFDTLLPKMERDIDRSVVTTMLGLVFDILDRTTAIVPLVDGRRRKGQWNTGRFLGCILYDLHMKSDNIAAVQDKWVQYLTRSRRNEPDAEKAIDIPGASGSLNLTKLARMSYKVSVYVTQNRLATKEELKPQVHHDDAFEYDEEEDDEEDGSSTD